MRATFYICNEEEYPYGLRCMDCDTEIPPGTPYSERLVSMAGEDAVCEIVCVYCAVKGMEES